MRLRSILALTLLLPACSTGISCRSAGTADEPPRRIPSQMEIAKGSPTQPFTVQGEAERAQEILFHAIQEMSSIDGGLTQEEAHKAKVVRLGLLKGFVIFSLSHQSDATREDIDSIAEVQFNALEKARSEIKRNHPTELLQEPADPTPTQPDAKKFD